MTELLTPQIVLAIIGGVVGGFSAATNEIYTTKSARIADFMVGVTAAVGSTHFLPPEALWLAILYGLIAGALGSNTLDILRGLLPRIIRLIAQLKFGLKDLDK